MKKNFSYIIIFAIFIFFAVTSSLSCSSNIATSFPPQNTSENVEPTPEYFGTQQVYESGGMVQVINTIPSPKNQQPSIAIQFLVDDTRSVFDKCGQASLTRYLFPSFISRTFKYLSQMEVSNLPDMYIGVASFSTEYKPIIPLGKIKNLDLSVLNNTNNDSESGIDSNAQDTNFVAGLIGAHEELENIKNNQAKRFVIMITDGEVNSFDDLSNGGKISNQLQELKEENIGVYVGLLCPDRISLRTRDEWKAKNLAIFNTHEIHIWDTKDHSDWGQFFVDEVFASNPVSEITGWVKTNKESGKITIPADRMAKIYRFSYPEERKTSLITYVNGRPTTQEEIPFSNDCKAQSIQFSGSDGPGFFWLELIEPILQAGVKIVPSENWGKSTSIIAYQFPGYSPSDWINLDHCFMANISQVKSSNLPSETNLEFSAGSDCSPEQKIEPGAFCRVFEWVPSDQLCENKVFGNFSWRFGDGDSSTYSARLELPFLFIPQPDYKKMSPTDSAQTENTPKDTFQLSFNFLPNGLAPEIYLKTKLLPDDLKKADEILKTQQVTPDTRQEDRCLYDSSDNSYSYLLVRQRALHDQDLDWNQPGYSIENDGCSTVYKIRANPHVFTDCGYDTVRFFWTNSEKENPTPIIRECHLSPKITCDP